MASTRQHQIGCWWVHKTSVIKQGLGSEGDCRRQGLGEKCFGFADVALPPFPDLQAMKSFTSASALKGLRRAPYVQGMAVASS
jgi:hypothetical protein